MIRLEKTIVAGSMALLLAGTSFFMPQNKAMAARIIKIDGNPSEFRYIFSLFISFHHL